MAWKYTLLPASFAGIGFDIKSVDDQGKNLLVKSAYPYRNGADVENLGRDAHSVPMEIVLWNEDNLGNYEQTLKDLVTAFESLSPSELVHPIFGVLSVFAEDWRVHHSEEEFDYCTVSVTFVEAGADVPFFNRSLPQALGGLAGLQALRCLDGLLAQFEAYMSVAASYLDVTSNGVALLRDYWARLVSPLFALRADARAVVRDVFALPRLALSDVVALLQGVYAVSERAACVLNQSVVSPLLVAGTGVVVDGHVGQGGQGGLSGLSGFAPNFTRAMVLRDVQAVQVGVAAALNHVDNSAVAMAADTRSFEEVQNPVSVSVSGVAYVLRSVLVVADAICAAAAAAQTFEWELIDPTLSPAQAAGLLNTVREPLRHAVDVVGGAFAGGVAYRADAAQGLGLLAWQLTAAARALINLRPALVDHVVGSDTNLHLLAHVLYGDFSRAYELARLNPEVRDPNAVRAGDVLRVYVD